MAIEPQRVIQGRWVKLSSTIVANGETLRAGTRLKIIRVPHPVKDHFWAKKGRKEYRLQLHQVNPA